uniref:Uncharacterized protein n=1 Tax=Arundo donax TaxID=35708 RepID=A0A0A8ZZ71_ARUDO
MQKHLIWVQSITDGLITCRLQ